MTRTKHFINPVHLCLSLLILTITVVPTRGADQSPDESPPSKYLRFVADDRGGGTLQASVVRFENAQGVTVDLVAAVHIGERAFYAALEESFADYDVVLYELVAPKEMLSPATQNSTVRKLAPATRRSATHRTASMAWVGGLQRTLKDTLKLSFQLEEIDYHKPNFIHADLDAETFAQMQDERGESIFSLMLASMLREMSKPSAGAQPDMGALLMALRSPDRARQLKLILGRQFGLLDDQLSGWDNGKGTVLLTERNKAALKVLKDQLSSGDKKSFAIFYGAGHLKGMEKILTKEMSFHQVGPPFWRVAWDMTAPPSPTTRPTSRPATKAGEFIHR